MTAEMLIHEAMDDERTLDEEEALESKDDVEKEMDDLEKVREGGEGRSGGEGGKGLEGREGGEGRGGEGEEEGSYSSERGEGFDLIDPDVLLVRTCLYLSTPNMIKSWPQGLLRATHVYVHCTCTCIYRCMILWSREKSSTWYEHALTV